ncbi:uncharacterized protein PgNI_09499 [Pyricularia grisea]|uniref:Uncharacterized protein n=1 Tax=Pyricularia grisea TaxID=148305 RepID=A0A6P8AR59_PYRGI|nr:uncharacterized protein PgNI_09499 [Pyricularia grisea]TLD04614.1 hypothetical protein PgNI_09499 [Pyricularia grisea]
MANPEDYEFSIKGRAYKLSAIEKATKGTVVRVSALTSKALEALDPALTELGGDEGIEILVIGLKPPQSSAEAEKRATATSINSRLADQRLLTAATAESSTDAVRVGRVYKGSGRMYAINRESGLLVAHKMKYQEAFIFSDFRDDFIIPKAQRTIVWASMQKACTQRYIWQGCGEADAYETCSHYRD